MLAELQAELDSAIATRASCDELIQTWGERARADLSSPNPVQAWKGRYGERGALAREILRYVELGGPGGVSTVRLATHMAKKFGLDFTSNSSFQAWSNDSVREPVEALRHPGGH